MKVRLKRYSFTNGEEEGSVFACSRACAEDALLDEDYQTIECEGDDGVDDLTICEGCGAQDGDEEE